MSVFACVCVCVCVCVWSRVSAKLGLVGRLRELIELMEEKGRRRREGGEGFRVQG